MRRRLCSQTRESNSLRACAPRSTRRRLMRAACARRSCLALRRDKRATRGKVDAHMAAKLKLQIH
eukprot:5748713-Pleurochrysis_carterae.AAC.2